MLIDLTVAEMILIRDAVREFRIVAPDHVKANPDRLARWQEFRELYSREIVTTDTKMTDAIASTV